MFEVSVSARNLRVLSLGLCVLLGTGVAMAAGSATAGKAKAAVCGACHGADGNPPPGLPYPTIAGQSEEYIARQLHLFKRGEASPKGAKDRRVNVIMAQQVAKLSDADIQDLSAYFASQKPRVTGARDPELVKQGERIYRGGIMKTGVSACMSCHGPAGHGIPPVYPRVSGQNAAYMQQQLLDFKTGARKDSADIMTRIAFRMSEAEIKAVAEYMAGLH